MSKDGDAELEDKVRNLQREVDALKGGTMSAAACPLCERGEIVKRQTRLTRPFRHLSSLTAAYEIGVPTCNACGEQFFDRPTAEALSGALNTALVEKERDAFAARVKELEAELTAIHNKDLPAIEAAVADLRAEVERLRTRDDCHQEPCAAPLPGCVLHLSRALLEAQAERDTLLERLALYEAEGQTRKVLEYARERDKAEADAARWRGLCEQLMAQVRWLPEGGFELVGSLLGPMQSMRQALDKTKGGG